ncbi:hypothetical protein GCM10027030_16560 [Luteococcus sediminum]
MKLARMALPMAALALVAGCSTPNGGTAFEVDGDRVAMGQVDSAADGCARVIKQDAAAVHGEVARMLLVGSIGQAIAEQTRTAITPAMRSEALAKLQGEQLLADPQCATAVNAFADYAAINQELGQQKVAQAVKGLDVKVNPRFGNWDASRGSFTGASGSLSVQDIGQGEIVAGR